MQLHISSECITVKIHECSKYYTHVSDTLSKNFSKTFWVNETLINLASHKEMQKRKEFLTSLYYTCAQASQTHNMAFLQKLITLHDKPIKVVRKQSRPPKTHNAPSLLAYYTLLDASREESLTSIRKKYLRLAKRYHPDLASNQTEHTTQSYTEKFQKIQEAYAYVKAEKSKKRAA